MPSNRTIAPRWALVADALAIALLLLAFYVSVEGGFVAKIASVQISLRSAWRVFMWAGIVLLSRHVLVRNPPIYAWLVSPAVAAGPLVEDRAGPISDARDRWVALSPRLRAFIVVSTFVVLTAGMTYPQVLSLTNRVAINEGDALFSAWRLAWVAHQLPRDPLHLFDANIFYPERRTLAFSDSMIVPSLMTAPLFWLGLPPLLVYNLIFLAGFALSGVGMFLLVRSLTGSVRGAFFAGFVFAFLPFRFVHYAHLELQMSQWMPLALWAFHRTLKSGRVRDGLLTGFFIALQCLSSWYYGIFFVTFLGALGLALLIGNGIARARAAVAPLGAGAVLAACLVVPMAIPYFAARENVGDRPEWEIEFYSATPTNYLAAHPQNVLYGKTTSKLGGQERELFMGFLVPLVALVGLWPPLSAARIGYALGLLLAFDVSLGFNGVVHPWLHGYVLPYRGLRVPARMAMVVGLALAVLAGYGMARLLSIVRDRKARAALFAALAFGTVLEYWSVPELKRIDTRPPPIYDALPADMSGVVLLELPLLSIDIAIEPLYMYYSTFRWYNMVNGYSGFSPPTHHLLRTSIEHFPDDVSLAELRRRKVTHVVVHGELYREGEYQTLIGKIDASPDLERVMEIEWRDRPMRMYRLK